MLFMAPDELKAKTMYPADCGFTFPSIANKTPLTYIDLHGGGTSGYGANVMLTFYYTVP